MNNEEIRVCRDCGEEIHGEYWTIYNNRQEEYICENCYDDHYCSCDDCNVVMHVDDANWVNGGDYAVCESCYQDSYFTCEDCGSIYHNNDGRYIEDRDCYICDSCYDHGDYGYCDDCNNCFTYDNLHQVGDDYYCDDCVDDHEQEGDYDDRIRSYHSFSSWVKYKSENEVNTIANPLEYIGSEIELEPKGDHKMKSLLDAMEKYLNAIVATDGSLNYGGVEIITHPETFKYKQEHKENYKQFFKKVEELEYGHDYHSGLHFHVSRPNNEVISRIIVILESFKDEIKTLSRRDGNFGYSRFLSDTCGNNEKQKVKYQSKKWLEENYVEDRYHDRYSALNLQNRNTIEFRFFNGANNFEEFWGALQFIHNIMKIAHDTRIDINNVKWMDLIKGQELEEQARKLGVFGIDKTARDTTDIIEKLEATLRVAKEELKCVMKNLARYINKEMSELDISEIRTSNVDFIEENINQFIDKFKYRKQYLDKIMNLYNILNDTDNTIEMGNIKQYWEDTKYSYPVNTERYKRYDKLVEKIIKKYESEVM